MVQDKKKAASVEAMCVWRHTPPILCPTCKLPTSPTWNDNYKDEFGQRLWLRACPKCEKVFTPEPELKLIEGLPIVHDRTKSN